VSTADRGADADSSGADLPRRSQDEEAVGWGDERYDDPQDPDDTARLLVDRPPHHDREQ
jgi:hypothetical protein